MPEREPMDQDEYLRRENIDIDKDEYESPDETVERIMGKADREHLEGVTAEMEDRRREGKLPTTDETLAEINAAVDRQEKLQRRLESGGEKTLTSDTVKLIDDLKQSFHHISARVRLMQDGERRDAYLGVIAKIADDATEMLTLYQAGIMTEKNLDDRLRGHRQRIWQIEHEVDSAPSE